LEIAYEDETNSMSIWRSLLPGSLKSVRHTCDLLLHLSTNRNNFGVVGKPHNSGIRKSKFRLYGSTLTSPNLRLQSIAGNSQVSLAYAVVPLTALAGISCIFLRRNESR
jgi:hypothetical protein